MGVQNFNTYNNINEGKLENVQIFPNFVRYNGEDFPGFNVPKRYIGKKPYKWRVLAKYGNKVKPINFGNVLKKEKPLSIFQKKYWENLPTYK